MRMQEIRDNNSNIHSKTYLQLPQLRDCTTYSLSNAQYPKLNLPWRAEICSSIAHMPKYLQISLYVSSQGTKYFNKTVSIHWQDSAPPISGYWPTSEPNAGEWRNNVTAAELWGEVCATQVLPMGSVSSRSDIKGTQLPPANILIPFERQLIALKLTADSFYIMKLCSRLFVLYCPNCPKDDRFR